MSGYPGAGGGASGLGTGALGTPVWAGTTGGGRGPR